MDRWWIPVALGVALIGPMGIAPNAAAQTSGTSFSLQKSVRITQTTTRDSTSVQTTGSKTTTTTINGVTKTSTSTHSTTLELPGR